MNIDEHNRLADRIILAKIFARQAPSDDDPIRFTQSVVDVTRDRWEWEHGQRFRICPEHLLAGFDITSLKLTASEHKSRYGINFWKVQL